MIKSQILFHKGECMKKKIAFLLIALSAFVFALTGCGKKVDVLSDIGGKVSAGNGTAVVEKGDYVYFVNGKEAVSASNKIGTPVKGSLMRVKKSELNKPETANYETVINKLFISGQYDSGLYFFGNTVYFASPYTEKDKAGNVQNTKTAFKKYDLSSGKYDEKDNIAICDDNTAKYVFAEKEGKVYLTYAAKNDDGNTILKCVSADDGKEVFTSDVYASATFSKANDGKVFFTKTGYSESLKKDESFNSVYYYETGATEAKLVLSGVGTSAEARDKNQYTDIEGVKYVVPGEDTSSTYQGAKFDFISFNGNYLIFSATTVGNSTKNYYGIDVTGGVTTLKDADSLGLSSANTTDKAITATSYYKSLEEIYYIDSSYGLVKFTPNKNIGEETPGVIVSDECSSLTIMFVDGDVMYLANTSEGIYYQYKYTVKDAKIRKINAAAMTTASDYFVPRVIGGQYFIGNYSADQYGKYAYVINMAGIDDAAAEGEEDNAYAKALAENAKSTRSATKALYAQRLGLITDADKTAYEEYLNGLSE